MIDDAVIKARSRAAPPQSRFSRGDRVRYVASRANPPKTQSISYTVVAVMPGARVTSYRIKGDTESYERVAREPQLAPLD